MKTMSDFIMEQEITTSSANDEMEIMEGFMKVQAIGAVAECYCEHAAISDFATEAGLSVFSESDDNIMKKAWNATKEFFSKIWEWLKALVKSVINFFTKSSIDRLIVKLEELEKAGDFKDTTEIKGIDLSKIDAAGVLQLVDEFSDNIKKSSETTDSAAMKGFIERAEAYLKKDSLKENFKQNDEKSTSLTELKSLLKSLSAKDVPSSGRKLLKKLDFDKENYKKGGTGDDKDKIDKDLVKSIKKAANLVAKSYDAYVDNTVKLVNKILKKNLKAEDYKELNKSREAGFENLEKSRDKTKLGTESYAENTDGYYFL